MEPTTGRIVHYQISENDVKRVAEQRSTSNTAGGKVHHGNNPSVGDVVPLIIVRVWPDEYGPGIPGVNGQAILDGDDVLWVCSAAEGTKQGQWSWPVVVL